MSLDEVKSEIASLLDREIMLQISGSRNKKSLCKGVINNVYSNIFTVLIDGVNKSFSYSDVAIGDVKIFHI